MGVEVFEGELALIGNGELRQFVRECLSAAPEYFWWIPASMTAKHHPDFARGGKGLVKHTRAAVRVFVDLAEAYPGVADRDACVAALLLHDTFKCGASPDLPPKTLPEHPLLPEQYFAGLKEKVAPEVWEAVFSRVRAHMGRWGPVMPVTPDEWLVHLADYIASREWASGLAEILRGGGTQ